MPLKELLGHIIDTNEIKKTEIEKKCRDMGIQMSKGYIGKIIKGKIKKPEEEKLQAIAKALGIHERQLVIENYLDTAPEEIKEIFKKMRLLAVISGKEVYKDLLECKILEDYEETVKKEYLSNTIIELLELKSENIQIDRNSIRIKEEKDGFTVQLFLDTSIPILDNSIKDLPEGERIKYKCQEKYEEGDLIVFKLKKSKEKYLIRQYLQNGKEIILKANRPGYEPIKCKKEDIFIYGKVDSLVTKIQ